MAPEGKPLDGMILALGERVDDGVLTALFFGVGFGLFIAAFSGAIWVTAPLRRELVDGAWPSPFWFFSTAGRTKIRRLQHELPRAVKRRPRRIIAQVGFIGVAFFALHLPFLPLWTGLASEEVLEATFGVHYEQTDDGWSVSTRRE